MSELDKFFGVKIVDPTPAIQAANIIERAMIAGRREPRDFYKYSNAATKALAEAFSQDTGIPVKSAGGKNQHKRCARLLAEVADYGTLIEALDYARRRGLEPGINLYYLAKIVENKASYLKAKKDRKVDTWDTLTQDIDQGDSITCTSCGLEVFQYTDDKCTDCLRHEKRKIMNNGTEYHMEPPE